MINVGLIIGIMSAFNSYGAHFDNAEITASRFSYKVIISPRDNSI
jgi:hypothetical protein